MCYSRDFKHFLVYTYTTKVSDVTVQQDRHYLIWISCEPEQSHATTVVQLQTQANKLR